MIATPSFHSLGLLLLLSFFLGFAFEDFFAKTSSARPGGIRTFPLLSLGGGMLYLFDPTHLIPFTGGLVVLGAWLAMFYGVHLRERDEKGERNAGLVVLLLNVHAYLLGAVALALPHWVAVGVTVVAVLLLTGRDRLHTLARRIDMKEITTAGQFLILTGVVLPLLPAEPVTTLTSITPRQAWLALTLVCTLSYASYLAQRYWPRAARGLWMPALGGLYSSTATTVVLARQANADPASRRQALAGITLATGIMYLRILAIIAVFNLALARQLAVPMAGLAALALSIAALQYWLIKAPAAEAHDAAGRGNPLELGTAAAFAAMFVLISLASTWVKTEFGTEGIYWLAAIVGFADIDPFVLNLAQGGTAGIGDHAVAIAVLIAASSNNILKAGYALSFGGRATLPSGLILVGLAAGGVALALLLAGIKM
ncbi:MgtC/SapB family protein [Rhodopseudomonas sp. NSM]|uniref:MgtC/SapB family protein n=1 Tax=Rhodopseudomonas sp. NSM TaxID=3457630 RepID=UPI004035F4F5